MKRLAVFCRNWLPLIVIAYLCVVMSTHTGMKTLETHLIHQAAAKTLTHREITAQQESSKCACAKPQATEVKSTVDNTEVESGLMAKFKKVFKMPKFGKFKRSSFKMPGKSRYGIY